MSYLAMENYSRKWIFSHSSMPVPEQALAEIKVMTPERSAQFWQENISKQSPDMDRLSNQDWAMQIKNWHSQTTWMAQWESDDPQLPEEITHYLDWQDDVRVYFCYEKYQVIETQWHIFKRHWKNFLFYDDGPMLLARRRQQALWFQDNGTVKLGIRPKD